RRGCTAVTLVLILAGVIANGDPARGELQFLALPFDDPAVQLVQGWLYATPDSEWPCPEPEGKRCHRGIDYAKGGPGRSAEWTTFRVLAAADGRAVQSVSTTYGKFVYIVHPKIDTSGRRYFTIYAHLKSVVPDIPSRTLEQLGIESLGQRFEDFNNWVEISRGDVVGDAGSTGA